MYDENARLGRSIRLRSGRVTLNAWHHIALVRSNVTLRLFVDGFLVDSRATSRTVTTFNTITKKYDRVFQTYRYDLTAGAGSHYVGGGQARSEGDTRIYDRGGNVWVDSVRISDVSRYEPAPIILPTTSFAPPPGGDVANVMILNLENDYADTGIRPRAMKKTGTVLTSLSSPFNSATNTANSVVFTPFNFLRVPHSSNLNFPSKFIIEFWLLLSSTRKGQFTVFAKTGTSGTTNRTIDLRATTSGWTLRLNFTGVSGWSAIRTINSGQIYDEWTHFLLSKDSNVYKFFQNGELIHYQTEASSALYASTADLTLGSDTGLSTNGTGLALLNNFRYMTGVSMAANIFGVPTQDLGIPDSSDTSIKLQLAQTGNALTDASIYNNTVENRYSIYAGSNIFAAAVSPFGGGGLASYYWTTPFVSFVKIPFDAELQPLTTDTFTVEFFYRFTNISVNSRVDILSNAPTPQINMGQFMITLTTTGADLRISRYSVSKKDFPDILQPFSGLYGLSVSGAVTNPTEWNHFAWVSDAGEWKFYINGLTNGRSFKTGINTGAVRIRPRPSDPDVPIELDMNNGLYIARPLNNSPGFQWRGGLHGLRISDHVKYNAPFTVPDIPLDRGGGVSLLSFDEPGLFSRPTGGFFSVSFPGTSGSGWLLYGKQLSSFSALYGNYRGWLETHSSDFTIELYAKFPAFPSSDAEPGGAGFSVLRGSASNRAKVLIAPYGSLRWSGICIGPNKIYYVQKAATDGTSGWSNGVNHGMSTDVWYHIAIERSSTTINYYIDGNLAGSESMTGTWNWDNNDNFLSIGSLAYNNSLEVSIFNVRISTVALYNGSGFSPPSDPYQLIAGDTNTAFIGLTTASDSYTPGVNFKTPVMTTYTPIVSKNGFVFYNVDTPLTIYETPKTIKYKQYGTIVESKSVPFDTTLGGSQLFLASSVRNDNSVPITLVGSDARQLGVVDYTVEGWVFKHTAWQNKEPILNFGNVGYFDGGGVVLRSLNEGGSYLGYVLRWPDGGRPDARSFSFKEVYVNRGIAPPVNTWFHVAVVKSGTSLSIFESGNLVYTTVDARHNMPATQLVLGGTKFDNIGTPISFSNWRVSIGALYRPNVDYPNVFNSLGDPFFTDNVGALAHFSNPNYRWKGAPPTSNDNFSFGFNHGFAQKIYLTQGPHTINVSAVCHTFQGKWGADIADPAGEIIWMSRNDPRDNNLGYLRHPESTVRGIHVTYPGAKPFYYQNALFGPPETMFQPAEKFVDKSVLNNGNYDPYSGGFDLSIGQQKSVVIRDPVTKTTTTKVVKGKLAVRTIGGAARGKFINVAVEGAELCLKFSGGGAFTTMENCTFMFPNVSTDPTFTPALRIGHFNQPSGTAYSANLVIKNSVFGDTQGRFTRNTIQSMVIGNGPYWRNKPSSPIFGSNALLDTSVARSHLPIMDNSVFGANLAPNTFVITNTILTPETVRTGFSFRYGTTDSQRVITEGTNPAGMSFYSGATTRRDFYTPRASTSGSAFFPSIGSTFYSITQQRAGTTYPYAVANSGLLPSTSENWRINLMVYHDGVFGGQFQYENIFINGDYKGIGEDRFFPSGTLYPGSIQLYARSENTFIRTTGSGVNRVVTTYPGNQRFKLFITRVGHPTQGARSTFLLQSSGWYYINEWHEIDISYFNNVLAMKVNGALVAQNDFNRTTANITDPTAVFSNHNTTRFILGRPPLYNIPGGLSVRHWSGYINRVRSFVGSPLSQSEVGVYSGAYRWYLPWQT
jgi:hypothetical protein